MYNPSGIQSSVNLSNSSVLNISQPHSRSHNMTLQASTKYEANVDFNIHEPTSFNQAIKFLDWRAIIDIEIQALRVNGTWKLVPP